MIKTLKDTTTSDIQAAVTEARQRLGATSGLVFTLCVVADLRDFTSVLASCIEAGREQAIADSGVRPSGHRLDSVGTCAECA